jgi:hypothetical protein
MLSLALAAEAASRADPALGQAFALFEESSLMMLRGRVFDPEQAAEVLDMVVFRPKEGVGPKPPCAAWLT